MADTDRKGRIVDMAAGASPTLARLGDGAALSRAERIRPVLPQYCGTAQRLAPQIRIQLVVTAGVLVGLIGWVSSGHAVAVPVAVVALVSVHAGVSDARTLVIPNRLVLAGLTAVAVGAPLVALADERPFGDVAAAVAAGLILGGAPMLFALWLVRPAGVGGGDWKILTVQSAAVGMVAPFAVPLILLGGGIGAVLVQRVIRHRRHELPLGPGLGVGYLAAIVAALMWHELLGGPYT